jgi:hypothetical protein
MDGETDRDGEREIADAGDEHAEKAAAALLLISTGIERTRGRS